MTELGPLPFCLLGSFIQYLFIFLFPSKIALLPTAAFGVIYLIKFVFTADVRRADFRRGTQRSSSTIEKRGNVLMGRYTAQPPNADGSPAKSGAETEIVVFIIGATINHRLGRAAPGFAKLGKYFGEMWADAAADRRLSGFLGKTEAMTSPDSGTEYTTTSLSYWRDIESLHAFAQTPLHMEGVKWFNRITKQYPHIGIMHEVYAVPKGQWENTYINYQPFGMGQTLYPIKDKDGNDELVSPLISQKVHVAHRGWAG